MVSESISIGHESRMESKTSKGNHSDPPEHGSKKNNGKNQQKRKNNKKGGNKQQTVKNNENEMNAKNETNEINKPNGTSASKKRRERRKRARAREAQNHASSHNNKQENHNNNAFSPKDHNKEFGSSYPSLNNVNKDSCDNIITLEFQNQIDNISEGSLAQNADRTSYPDIYLPTNFDVYNGAQASSISNSSIDVTQEPNEKKLSEISEILHSLFSHFPRSLIMDIILESKYDIEMAASHLDILSGDISINNFDSSNEQFVEEESDTAQNILPEFPSLSAEQRKIIFSFGELFNFLTHYEICNIAMNCSWNQFDILKKLEKAQSSLSSEESNNSIQVPPSNLSFPTLNNDRANDVKYKTESIDKIYNHFLKKIDRSIIEGVLEQCEYSHPTAVKYLCEIYPGILTQNAPKVIVSQPNPKSPKKKKCKNVQKNVKNVKKRGYIEDYIELMNQAKECAQDRWESLSKSYESHRRVNEFHNAQRYAVEANQYARQVFDLHQRAYKILSSCKLDGDVQDVIRLDLHNYNVEESCKLFTWHYTTLRKLGVKKFKCITGLGKHSKNNAKIRPKMIELCEKNGISFKEKEGRLDIILS